MSSGMFFILFDGVLARRPIRPLGHPPVPHTQWTVNPIGSIFGSTNAPMQGGICGAPLVFSETARDPGGDVVEFFYSVEGHKVICETLDDLIAEGWRVQ